MYGHPGTLDAYGCHSNKALYGTTSWRECHADLLTGQVFKSTTAEYHAYIAAQKALIGRLQTELDKFNASYVGAFTLGWEANTEPDLAGYRVHCGTTSRGYSLSKELGKTTTQRMTDLKPGTYYCAVTAVDTSGNESALSNEVMKVLP